MSNLINREETYDVLTEYYHHTTEIQHKSLREALERVHDAEPEWKTGKWIEKEVIYADGAKKAIEAWQSCKCSACGRYDTRPYLYYFSEPRFCSWCGMRMKGEHNE